MPKNGTIETDTHEPFWKVIERIENDLIDNEPKMRQAYNDAKDANPSLFAKADLMSTLDKKLISGNGQSPPSV